LKVNSRCPSCTLEVSTRCDSFSCCPNDYSLLFPCGRQLLLIGVTQEAESGSSRHHLSLCLYLDPINVDFLEYVCQWSHDLADVIRATDVMSPSLFPFVVVSIYRTTLPDLLSITDSLVIVVYKPFFRSTSSTDQDDRNAFNEAITAAQGYLSGTRVSDALDQSAHRSFQSWTQ
jgi:hypothetical protein